MSKSKIKKEINECIYKYQKDDINEKLISIFGDDFRKYREDFNKTQNYLETEFIPDFPITVSLELVNRCNLNCVMCYKKHHTKPKAELSIDILKKILSECKENKLPSIMLALGSEILMYKEIKEVLDMVRRAGIQDVFFGTNGVMMNEDIIESIIRNKISRVEISLDASTAETYNKVRRVPVFEKVEENLNKLVEAKKKAGSQLPIIRLCFVVMDVNKHETESFIRKWKNKVDYIDFQRYFDVSLIDSKCKVDKKTIQDSFCSQPFYSLSIWADGVISPCCCYFGKKLVIGDIYKDTLRDVWNSLKMKKIRDQIKTKNFNYNCQKCLYSRDRNIIKKHFKS